MSPLNATGVAFVVVHCSMIHMKCSFTVKHHLEGSLPRMADIVMRDIPHHPLVPTNDNNLIYLVYSWWKSLLFGTLVLIP